MQKRIAFIFLVLVQRIIANDGASDLSFSGGIVRTGTGSTFAGTIPVSFAVAVQADGKIVTTGQNVDGNFQTVRYNTDGSLDTSFNGGVVIMGPGFGSGIALQPDGKIVVFGSDPAAQLVMISTSEGVMQRVSADPSTFLVVRYLSNGILDPSFGVNGIINQGSGVAIGGAVQVDNKILACGTIVDNSGNNFYAVV